MDKSGVDHSVGSRCAAAKAFEIFERTAMHVGSRRDKGLGCRIRASEAEHLTTIVDQFWQIIVALSADSRRSICQPLCATPHYYDKGDRTEESLRNSLFCQRRKAKDASNNTSRQ